MQIMRSKKIDIISGLICLIGTLLFFSAAGSADADIILGRGSVDMVTMILKLIAGVALLFNGLLVNYLGGGDLFV